ncbi:hypothetical protein BGZ54_002813, partial [Gamsiella multidivaricata]
MTKSKSKGKSKSGTASTSGAKAGPSKDTSIAGSTATLASNKDTIGSSISSISSISSSISGISSSSSSSKNDPKNSIPPPVPSIPRIDYIGYESEHQLQGMVSLIENDLSEPYSIYTYRYFLHQWPKLSFL